MHNLIGILILFAIAFALIKALLTIASAIVSAIFIFFIKYWAILIAAVIIFTVRFMIRSEIENLSSESDEDDEQLYIGNSMYAKHLETLVEFREAKK